MANNTSEGFIPTTKFYKSANGTAMLASNKRDQEEKAEVQKEGTAIKKQENTKTKQIAMQKIYANNIHAKLNHPKEDKMHATVNHLHHRIKRTLEFCE